MGNIKSFEEFVLNEGGSALGLLGGILSGNIDIFSKPGEQDVEGDQGASGDSNDS